MPSGANMAKWWHPRGVGKKSLITTRQPLPSVAFKVVVVFVSPYRVLLTFLSLALTAVLADHETRILLYIMYQQLKLKSGHYKCSS